MGVPTSPGKPPVDSPDDHWEDYLLGYLGSHHLRVVDVFNRADRNKDKKLDEEELHRFLTTSDLKDGLPKGYNAACTRELFVKVTDG